MELVEDEVFESVSVTVDGRSFTRCRLVNCELLYSGGHFSMTDTLVSDCRWAFGGPARRTMEVLDMFHILDEGLDGADTPGALAGAELIN